jgi:hypothetical protein
MPSLPDLQRRFAGALHAGSGEPHPGIAIYRNTVAANYRNALAATYCVVRALLGDSSFDAAVDAFVKVHPSTRGDLNVYGGELADFLANSENVRERPILPEIARLEWAIDEAHRAADAEGSAEATLAALAAIPASDIASQRFTLDPSCRLLRSEFPILRMWRAHQPDHGGEAAASSNAKTDFLIARRERGAVVVERLAAGDYAWLASLADGADLAGALESALAAEATFDLGTTLRAFIANGTICGVAR